MSRRMRGKLISLLFFLFTATLLCAPAVIGQGPTIDDTLVVCVAAHPDDIEIVTSGSLYKDDVGKHPMLWLVVTDGGADLDEYNYESNASQGWIAQDGQFDVAWEAPDGANLTRAFYSEDLAKKRCGGYFDGFNWTREATSHNSTFGVEYDWMTRVNDFVSASIEKSQIGYVKQSDPTTRLSYPDNSLSQAASTFRDSIAANLASEINKTVVSNGYQKSLVKIYSHAPDEICTNADEHPDHQVVGNAVRQAIELLLTTYGFVQIDAKWFTVYNPIAPKSGYVRTDEDISEQITQKTELAKACWETAFIHSRSINYTWIDYPEDPDQYEYSIVHSYYAPPLTPRLVVRGQNNITYYQTYNATTTSWAGWSALPGSTCDSPAAAVVGNELHLVVRGMDGNTLWHGYINLIGGGFSGWTLISGSTPSAPTLTTNGTHLCLVVRGGDNRIYHRLYNVASHMWAGWSVLPSGSTGDSPAAALVGNELHIVVRGMSGNKLYYCYRNLDTGTFSGWSLLSGASPSAPTLASNSTHLSLVVRGGDNRIYYRFCNAASHSWGSWSVLPSGSTGDKPAAAFTGDRLQFVVRGSTGGKLYHCNVNLASAAFSGWSLLSGSTPSAPTLTR
jgi:LmbE family N-acetylglucosaminyl deacetylase